MSDAQLDEFEAKILKEIWNYVITNPESSGLPISEIVDFSKKIGLPRGVFIPVMGELIDREFVVKQYDQESGDQRYQITSVGYRYLRSTNILILRDAVSAEVIPASDRFVSLGDNQQAQTELASAATDLDERLSAANQITGDVESDQALKNEAKSFRHILTGFRVREITLKAIKRCLESLKAFATKIEAKAIEQAVDRLLEAISQYFAGG